MPAGTPWLAWFVVAILTIAATAFTTWGVQRGNRAKIESIDAQVTNSHKGADFPNLREELTAFRLESMVALKDLRQDVGGLRSETRGLAEADRMDRAAAVDAHSQIYEALRLDRAQWQAHHAELMAAVKVNHGQLGDLQSKS